MYHHVHGSTKNKHHFSKLTGRKIGYDSNTDICVAGKEFNMSRKSTIAPTLRRSSSIPTSLSSPRAADAVVKTKNRNRINEDCLANVENWNKDRSENRCSDPLPAHNHVDSILKKYSVGRSCVDDVIEKYSQTPIKTSHKPSNAKSLDRLMTDLKQCGINSKNVNMSKTDHSDVSTRRVGRTFPNRFESKPFNGYSQPIRSQKPIETVHTARNAKSLDRLMTNMKTGAINSKNTNMSKMDHCNVSTRRVGSPFRHRFESSTFNGGRSYTPSSVNYSKSMSQIKDAVNDATNNCKCYSGVRGKTFCPVHIRVCKEDGCPEDNPSLLATPFKPACAFPPSPCRPLCITPPPCIPPCIPPCSSPPSCRPPYIFPPPCRPLCSSSPSCRPPCIFPPTCRPPCISPPPCSPPPQPCTPECSFPCKRTCASAPCIVPCSQTEDNAPVKRKKKKKMKITPLLESRNVYKENQMLRIERHHLRESLKCVGKKTLMEYAKILQNVVKRCERQAAIKKRNTNPGPSKCSSNICGGYTPSRHNKALVKHALAASACCPACPSPTKLTTGQRECSGYVECTDTSDALTSGVADCNMKPSIRILGEMAFQLERRILEFVFGMEGRVKRRFYGYTVSNIFYMLAKESTSPKGGQDTIGKSERSHRLEKVMCSLQKHGYQVQCHPNFSQDIINKYGVLACPPNEETLCEFRLQDPCALSCLITKLSRSNSEQTGLNVLLRCLCFLSKCDGNPLFVW